MIRGYCQDRNNSVTKKIYKNKLLTRQGQNYEKEFMIRFLKRKKIFKMTSDKGNYIKKKC